MKLWALGLQARSDGSNRNYLFLFFLKLHDYSADTAAEYAKLLYHEGVAIGPTSGHFKSLDYLDPSVMAPFNPEVGTVPVSRYVDIFDEARYDLSYKPDRPGRLSETLQVSYDDGTKIDINLWEISDNIDPAEFNSIRQGYIGPGGRLFPSRMGRNTVPNLWAEKQKALAKMREYNQDFEFFVTLGLTGVMSNLPMGPIVGPKPPVSGTSGGRGTQTPARNVPPKQLQPEPAPPGKLAPGSGKTGVPGSQHASVEAQRAQEAMRPPQTPLPAAQQPIRDTLLAEHPGLHPNVATDAARGGARAMGPGGAGADVPLLNGGGREVSVHRGAFTQQSIGGHLQGEVAQAGTTEIYLQVNSAGASREGLLRMIPRLRGGYPELRGVPVKFYGPDGKVWWTGIFQGPP